MRKSLLLLFVAASVGCATVPPGAEAKSTSKGTALASAKAKKASKPKQICTRSRVTGTHLYTEICRDARAAAQERADTQNALLRPQATPRIGGN